VRHSGLKPGQLFCREGSRPTPEGAINHRRITVCQSPDSPDDNCGAVTKK